jgi:hypothetical protein
MATRLIYEVVYRSSYVSEDIIREKVLAKISDALEHEVGLNSITYTRSAVPFLAEDGEDNRELPHAHVQVFVNYREGD